MVPGRSSGFLIIYQEIECSLGADRNGLPSVRNTHSSFMNQCERKDSTVNCMSLHCHNLSLVRHAACLGGGHKDVGDVTIFCDRGKKGEIR